MPFNCSAKREAAATTISMSPKMTKLAIFKSFEIGIKRNPETNESVTYYPIYG